MEKYRLTLEREASMVGAAINITVSINGMPGEKMGSGSTRFYDLDCKPTSIRFNVVSMGLTTLDQTIYVNPEGYKDLKVRYKLALKLASFAIFTQKNSIKYEIIPGERRDSAVYSAEPRSSSYEETTPPPPKQNDAHRGDFCPHCGTKNPPDANFCSNCGRKL